MRTLATITALAVVAAVIVIGRPRTLPPDGTEHHLWHLTWYTASNTVLIGGAYNIPQDFKSYTSWPRRNFGEKYIRYHWFGKPTFRTPPETDGSYCVGRMLE